MESAGEIGGADSVVEVRVVSASATAAVEIRMKLWLRVCAMRERTLGRVV